MSAYNLKWYPFFPLFYSCFFFYLLLLSFSKLFALFLLICSHWCCLFLVTDAELQRLKDAFKRSSTLSSHMTRNLFVREVLGDSVPPRLADVRPLPSFPKFRKNEILTLPLFLPAFIHSLRRHYQRPPVQGPLVRFSADHQGEPRGAGQMSVLSSFWISH